MHLYQLNYLKMKGEIPSTHPVWCLGRAKEFKYQTRDRIDHKPLLGLRCYDPNKTIESIHMTKSGISGMIRFSWTSECLQLSWHSIHRTLVFNLILLKNCAEIELRIQDVYQRGGNRIEQIKLLASNENL